MKKKFLIVLIILTISIFFKPNFAQIQEIGKNLTLYSPAVCETQTWGKKRKVYVMRRANRLWGVGKLLLASVAEDTRMSLLLWVRKVFGRSVVMARCFFHFKKNIYDHIREQSRM